MSQAHSDPHEESVQYGPLMIRSGVGGVLMGLANLVPGISGGTMLLAAGIYPQFIRAVAQVSTLKFRKPSMIVLGTVVVAAMIAILGGAAVIKDFVVDHRWVAYSVFIGLTLGGLPVVWALIDRATGSMWAAAVVGFGAMAALAVWQSGHAGGAEADAGFLMMLVAGVAGASAMILPGVSGGYLLLVLGVYVPILSGIAALKDALRAGDLGAAWDPMIGVVVPVGVGVVVGVAVVSNALRWLLARFERETLGVLLGLLVGAVVGLWPFVEGVPPEVGDLIKGKIMTVELIAELAPKDYPTRTFAPSFGHIAAALGLIVAGFATTMIIARVSKRFSPPAG